MLPAPTVLSTFLKSASLLSLGVTVVSAPLLITAAEALTPSQTHTAQAISSEIEDSTDAGAFEPPSNPSPNRGTLITTTGTYFRPPSNPSPRTGPFTTTGTRQGSCLGDTETGFAMLGPEAPETIVGRTASTHPTFTWYLPETTDSFPVIFRLLAPNESGRLERIHTETLAYTPGFVTYQLPKNLPALTSGKEYQWQVVVECNPNYPSRALVQRLSFEVVAPPAELAQTASVTTTATAQATAYGQAGIWYEAIAAVAQATSPTDQQTRTGLLLDLAVSLQEDNPQLSEDIQAISEATSP